MKRYIPARIVLFPGLGADPRMFAAQKAVFGDDLECPGWLMPVAGEAFDDYVGRWAREIKSGVKPGVKPGAGDDRVLFLGGVSFGGMVAMQMARHLNPAAVILLGSCRSRHAKPARWRVAKRVGDMIPDWMLGRRMLAAGALWVSVLDGLDDGHRSLMMKMAADSDPKLVRWSGHACADWTFDPGKVPGFPGFPGFPPIHQIHGRHDAIIPLHHGDPDHVIPDGRHLIHFSHTQTVNRYIMDVVRRYAGEKR